MNKDKLSDQWQTPDDLFNALDKGGEYQGVHFDGFNFDIDLCATEENSKCKLHCRDYLTTDLVGTQPKEGFKDWPQPDNIQRLLDFTCFMNPPYSNPLPFVEKAWEDSKHCKIVCLLKVDTSTKWWSVFWEYNAPSMAYCDKCDGTGEICNINNVNEPLYDTCFACLNKIYNGPKPGCKVIFFPKRIQFDPSKELIASGEVWREDKKWVKTCSRCNGDKIIDRAVRLERFKGECPDCNGKGYTPLSGPSFPSCLVIMDRRGI